MAVTVGPTPATDGRAHRAQGTRSAILAAAVELGSLRGLEELSMGGLASTVEMSKSGLFAHFGSKQELQLATIAEAWEIFEQEVLRPRPDDADNDLGAMLERWLSFHERKVFPGGCFFTISAVEFAGRRGAVSQALAAALERQTAALESAVHRAGERGEIRVRRNASQIAFGLQSILATADSLYRLHGDPLVFEHARATISELLGHRPTGPGA
jgi:AcrR family transcriptional regulator